MLKKRTYASTEDMMDKMIKKFGHEDPRTIKFCKFCEMGASGEQAAEFYKKLTGEDFCSEKICEKCGKEKVTSLFEVDGVKMCWFCFKKEEIKNERDWDE